MTKMLKGGAEMMALLDSLSTELETSIIADGLKAATEVIADEARRQVRSDQARQSIQTDVAETNGIVTARIMTIGKFAFLGPWLEFGTTPHLIRVADGLRQEVAAGRGRNRISTTTINRDLRNGSLKIGPRYVGESVAHPGARAHPFLRPALDLKESEAVDAMRARIGARLVGHIS